MTLKQLEEWEALAAKAQPNNKPTADMMIRYFDMCLKAGPALCQALREAIEVIDGLIGHSLCTSNCISKDKTISSARAFLEKWEGK